MGESVCTTCGRPIDDGQFYASMGGNIVPYLPAKLYHLRCVPTASLGHDSGDTKCYAVVFMNYYPLEVDSLWDTRKGAEKRIEELTKDWGVCEMEIRSFGDKVIR